MEKACCFEAPRRALNLHKNS